MTLPGRVPRCGESRVATELGLPLAVEDITPKLNRFGTYRLVPRWVPGFLARRALAHHSGTDGELPFSKGLQGSGSWFVGGAKAFYRAKHRMRMLTLYYQAEQRNLVVLGAANKTEVSIGLFVNHGCDSAADLLPIAELYKTQVRQLGEYLGVPDEILTKAPSPDMIPGVVDEFVIGVTYDVLDRILVGIEAGWGEERMIAETGCQLNTAYSCNANANR